MKLTQKCPTCSKVLELVSTDKFMNEVINIYKCGHAFAKDHIDTLNGNKLNLHSIIHDYKARPYQEEGVEFLLGTGKYESYSDIRGTSGILADQMRLGKTPQSLLAAKNLVETARLKGEDFPVLILARAANIRQWKREINEWCDVKPDAVWIIQGTKNWIPQGFKYYICSMDTFSRRGTCKPCKHQFHDEECKKCTKEQKSCRICIPNGDAMSDVLLEFGFKLVIADEAHSFKNSNSQRSIALTAFLKEIERSELSQVWNFQCPMCKHSWEETVTIKVDTLNAEKRTSKTSHCEKCFALVQQSAAQHTKVSRNCSIMLLSGTPIKNKAGEFFVPLNLIAPDIFPTMSHFQQNWLIAGDDGKYKRIHPQKWNAFQETIKPFFLRREKEDIYLDLPKLNRIFTPITIEDERLKKAYNSIVDELEQEVTSTGSFKYFDSIGKLQKLRQVCGLAKVQFVTDYALDFVGDSDRQKLAIGYHHYLVRDQLQRSLSALGTVKLDGQDGPQTKDRIAHRYFQTAPEQILLLGMLAAKEGLELPYIDTALVMEREWSSADEEQFEYRFYNPDPDYLKARGLENKITTIEYVVANGTVDEFFFDMVEEKRQIFGETLSKNWDATSDKASWKQLVERTVAGRL